MIDAHKIVWRGLESLEFDVTIHCSFDGDNGAVSSFLNRENIYTEHYDGRHTIHRSKYNEVFTPRFTLIKQDFSDFDETQNRKILSWLTSSDKPGWLEVYRDDSNVLTWQCFGNIINIEQYKLGNGSVVGYEFEMESSHPYAWSRKLTYPEVYGTIEEINNNDETNDYLAIYGIEPFTITCNTDEYNKMIYPTVTIEFSNSDIYIPVSDDTKLMDNSYVLIPNVIYKWKGGYYVNLPSVGSKVQLAFNNPITSSMDSVVISSSNYDLNGYYYFTQEGVIAQKIGTQDDLGQWTYEWKIITEVGAAIKIENVTAGTSTIVTGGAIGETIILDGTNKIISSYITVNGALVQNTKIIGNHFSWEWLPLNYGDNNITITGNCKVKIEWLEPRKVGDL